MTSLETLGVVLAASVFVLLSYWAVLALLGGLFRLEARRRD